MKLGTKFVILVVGITIVPFVAAFLAVALQLGFVRQGVEPNSMDIQVLRVSILRLFGHLVFLLLVLFSSVGSALIVRSIKRSISTLETAANRIASGDLDFEMTPRGSDEIASLTASFDTMRRKLKEEQARRARFVMGVSHDLKTPLALIQGYVDAICDGYADQPEKLEKYLSIIKDKSKVLEARIGQLIEFAKVDSEGWKASHVQVGLGEFLESLGSRYADESSVLGYSFDYSIDLSPDLSVPMDPELVTRALENILNNAIRYSESPKRVHLRVREEAGSVLISISNNGRGIPAQDLPHIFDPFYRGTNSRREDGFGLGLATVKSVIEAHGWSIRVASVPGGETTFTIEIKPDG